MMKPTKSYPTILMEMIREYAPLSKRKLQELTGLSWGLVSRVTNELAEKCYIVTTGKVDAGVGRKADAYDINRNGNYFIGVDFSGFGVRCVVTDMKGCVIDETGTVWEEKERNAVIRRLFELLDPVMKQYADRNILGIGFAVQGVVNVTEGISVYIGSIRDWNEIPLKQMVQERYGVEVQVVHDPDCLMRCERAMGILKENPADNVVLVHYIEGASIGMSVMVNGQLYLGHHEKANEIGHTILGKMSNGRYDFMDNHISKDCLEEDYRNLSVKGDSLTYREIVQGAKEGDLLCQKVFEHLHGYIGQSIAVVNSLLNPAILILHTVDCEFQEELYHTVEDYVRTVSYDKQVDFRISRLGNDAKAIGAAIFAVDHMISSME